ncbi:TIGR03862 family flavoprotein [Novispirillum itersonii]|uniref:TIGR03862 family flavoprotein n=1 Tax=Novispirillum itersonii TaxID=189 RepID=UPI00036A763B
MVSEHPQQGRCRGVSGDPARLVPARLVPARIVIVGGGPAGLYAAELLAAALPGRAVVTLYDAMPSPGRKFLLAGRGGLNLTHSEPLERFVTRYAPQQDWLTPMVQACPPQALRDWAAGLGIETFVGTSGRVFPTDFKAAPLMRAWLRRLRALGVQMMVRHRWTGFAPAPAPAPAPNGLTGVTFQAPDGPVTVQADAVLLALGGGSWARLGSDGAWMPLLEQAGVAVRPLRPANCGFLRVWTPDFAARFAGTPLKAIAVRTCGDDGTLTPWRKGEAVVSADGLEGSVIYAVSRLLRQQLEQAGAARLHLDLLPDRPAGAVTAAVCRPRGSRSWSTHLKKELGLDGVKLALLRDCTGPDLWADPRRVAAALKDLAVDLSGPRPIDEAISTAGGVCRDALTDDLQLKALPGVFCAGEMLDWEAPTGGYLLTGCYATARRAADGIERFLYPLSQCSA